MTWQVGVGSHCRSGTCRSGIRETRSLHREKRASRRHVYTNKRNIYQVTDALFIVIVFFLSLLLPHHSQLRQIAMCGSAGFSLHTSVIVEKCHDVKFLWFIKKPTSKETLYFFCINIPKVEIPVLCILSTHSFPK